MKRAKRAPKGSYVRVTTSTIYFFDERYTNGWDIERVVDEWFRNFPIDRSHAARDGARVGNSLNLLSVEVVDEDEAFAG